MRSYSLAEKRIGLQHRFEIIVVCALGKVGTDIRLGVSASVTMKNAALRYGNIGETTDTTQQTNTSLSIHLHTCVATFNPTRLSRCLPTE
jgi:hypothetical protein